jgi:hypothetical protein
MYGDGVYVTGMFRGTVDFCPGTGIVEETSNGWSDVFLSKFASIDSFEWVRTWGSESTDSGFDVVSDDNGNAYACGWFTESVDFDPGPGMDWHSSNGITDAFIVKYPPDGNW